MSEKVKSIVEQCQTYDEYINKYLSLLGDSMTEHRINALDEYRFALQAVLPIIAHIDAKQYKIELNSLLSHTKKAYSLVINCALKEMRDDIFNSYRSLQRIRFCGKECISYLEEAREILFSDSVMKLTDGEVLDYFHDDGLEVLNITDKLSKATGKLSQAMNAVNMKKVRIMLALKQLFLPLAASIITALGVAKMLNLF